MPERSAGDDWVRRAWGMAGYAGDRLVWEVGADDAGIKSKARGYADVECAWIWGYDTMSLDINEEPPEDVCPICNGQLSGSFPVCKIEKMDEFFLMQVCQECGYERTEPML
jgi:hypothetical protein